MCASCGALYVPTAAETALELAQERQRLKMEVQSPLEALAEAAEEDPLFGDLPVS